MKENFWCTVCNTPGLETKYDEKTGDEIMVCVNCKSHFSKSSSGFLSVIDNATHFILCDEPPIVGFA
jgi:transcription elongation factor Elf1